MHKLKDLILERADNIEKKGAKDVDTISKSILYID